MLEKPTKPKHYYRDYTLILMLAFYFASMTWHIEPTIFTLILLIVFHSLVAVKFRSYHARLSAYRDFKYELNTSSVSSNVNENIAKFKERKRIERENKKWWQLWL